jgi:hypothetical protein
MPLDLITDHQARAVARLTEHFRSRDTMPKLVRALTGPIQEIENVLQDLVVKRRLDVATGAQLAVIGRIVGQPRAGKDDETYRIWIRTRIRLNRTSGTGEDIIAVFRAVTQGTTKIVLEEQFPAAFVVRIGSDSIVPPAELAELGRQAKAAGVNVIVESATSDDTTSFACDPNGAGCGTTTNPGVGGTLAGAL